jgi:inner membrane protein
LDNLTHTLTGVLLARAGVGKGVPRAGVLLALSANAPDVDFISWLGGTQVYLEYHRWLTHALIGIPFMALLTVAVLRLFAKGRYPWGKAMIAATIGVLSHVLLDWTNTYGIRLFLPFSSEWLRLDVNNIVDLWIWLILLLAVIAPALGRLVSSEIGARPGTGKGWAIFALVLLSAYEYGRFLAHSRAVAVLNARIYDGAAPARVAAIPGFANPFAWRGIVETPDAYRLFTVDLNGTFDPTAGRVLYKNVTSSTIEKVRQTEAFRVFLDFSAFPYWRTLPLADAEGATRVEAIDLRFGDPQNARFVATAVINRADQVENATFSFTPGGED